MEKKNLTIAISSRALFDLKESNAIFERRGVEEYAQYQRENETVPLNPGVAFPLVQKLLRLNTDQENVEIEVILVSRNSADTGLRVFNSIRHYNLGIVLAAFTSGASVFPYIKSFGAHLFLSADGEDVRKALEAGIAAASILPSEKSLVIREEQLKEACDGDKGKDSGARTSICIEENGFPVNYQLRIAFDGDSVLFSDESERVFQEQGLGSFTEHEVDKANTPLPGGPFKEFLSILHEIQLTYPQDRSPIRTALITARAMPAHERVVKTLRSWNIRIDEALFLGGRNKTDYLKAFRADIFFDDQIRHCESAANVVPTGHVPYGVINRAGSEEKK